MKVNLVNKHSMSLLPFFILGMLGALGFLKSFVESIALNTTIDYTPAILFAICYGFVCVQTNQINAASQQD